jgi:hypothetical protein
MAVMGGRDGRMDRSICGVVGRQLHAFDTAFDWHLSLVIGVINALVIDPS